MIALLTADPGHRERCLSVLRPVDPLVPTAVTCDRRPHRHGRHRHVQQAATAVVVVVTWRDSHLTRWAPTPAQVRFVTDVLSGGTHA